jgi:lysosomal acid phosphatase
LKHIHIVFRHGDRTPYILFPHVPGIQPASSWPLGLKQLTSIGMKQHYILGTYLRRWYGNALNLNETYQREDIFVRSTDADRTLMSAASNLAGLYYLSTDESRILNDSLPWLPIPIHTTVKSTDYLLAEQHCPRYEELRTQMLNSDVARTTEKESAALLELLEKELSPPGKRVSRNITNVWEIQDTLFCQERHGMEQPTWFTTSIREEIYKINNLGWKLLYNTAEMAKLRTGILLTEITENLQQLSRGVNRVSGNKIIMYSAHDSNVAPLLAALNVSHDRQPPYASAVIFELHKSQPETTKVGQNEGKWFVRIRHYNDSDDVDTQRSPPDSLTLSHCDDLEDCPLDTFLSITQPVCLKQKDFAEACHIPLTNNGNVKGSDNAVLWFFLIFSLIIVVALVACAVVLKSRIRLLQYEYETLQTQQSNVNSGYEPMYEVV